MRIFIYTTLFGLFLSSVSPAQEKTWQSLFCKKANPYQVEWLRIEKSADGLIQVQTPETFRYLTGLECTTPSNTEPLFACQDRGNIGVRFQSAWVIERGFPSSEYGRYVDRKRLSISLTYQYQDNNNNPHSAERNWLFEETECSLTMKEVL
jgi:hypothetical protein